MPFSSFVVNGTKFENTDMFKIYNLGPALLYALDIYFISVNGEAIEWLLTRNTDTSSKIALVIDNDAVYDIALGQSGDKFSNPISYNRQAGVGSTIRNIPTHNFSYQQETPMIGGSMNSNVGTNWSHRFPNPSEDADKSLQFLNAGENDDFVTFEINASPSTDLILLNKYLPDIIICIEHSIYKDLPVEYHHFDNESIRPNPIKLGVRY